MHTDLFRQIAGCYWSEYSDFGAFVVDASTLPLDPIPPELVGGMYLKLLASVTIIAYVASTTRYLLSNKTFRTLLREQPTQERPTVVAKKWYSQICSLADWGLLRRVAEYQVAFTSGHFAVPKGTGETARCIFNGANLNAFFNKPPTVNLCPIEEQIRIASELATKEGKLTFVVADIRHYFHQIPAPTAAQLLFGLVCLTATGDLAWLVYTTLAMGFAYSPRFAQCLSWGILLHVEAGDDALGAEYDKDADNPPRWVPLRRKGKIVGFISILYDNFIICTSQAQLAEQWRLRLERNCRLFNVVLKNCTLAKESNVMSPKYVEIVHLGVAWGCRRTSTTASGWTLCWKHAEEKAQRWRALDDRLRGAGGDALTAREVARAVGVLVWDATVRGTPLLRLSGPIELLRKAAIAVAAAKGSVRHRWNAVIIENARPLLSGQLSRVMQNPWSIAEPVGAGEAVFAASDASDEALAGLLFEDDGSVGEDWFHIPCDRQRSIFLRELNAAVITVARALHSNPGVKRIVLGVDNTATVHCLRRRYSNVPEGREYLSWMQDELEAAKAELVVAPLRGLDNLADDPSHFRAPRCPVRRSRTFETLKNFLQGHGKECPVVDEFTSSSSSVEAGRNDYRHLDLWQDLSDAAGEERDEEL